MSTTEPPKSYACITPADGLGSLIFIVGLLFIFLLLLGSIGLFVYWCFK